MFEIKRKVSGPNINPGALRPIWLFGPPLDPEICLRLHRKIENFCIYNTQAYVQAHFYLHSIPNVLNIIGIYCLSLNTCFALIKNSGTYNGIEPLLVTIYSWCYIFPECAPNINVILVDVVSIRPVIINRPESLDMTIVMSITYTEKSSLNFTEVFRQSWIYAITY